MKKLIVTLAALSGVATFAGTGRALDENTETPIVARALAQAFPSIVGGDEATLDGCQIGNYANAGQTPVFQVLCDYEATATGFKATALFDEVKFVSKNSDTISAVTFKSLTRN